MGYNETFLTAMDKVWTLGRRETAPLWGTVVEVQEKYDGSQISWARVNGKLHVRSRRQHINVDSPPTLFAPAVAHLKSIEKNLRPNCIYRGEAFQKKKHNTLMYDRLPLGNIVLFSATSRAVGELTSVQLEQEAKILKIEPVQVINHRFKLTRSTDELNHLLGTFSSLGGTLVEGVVFRGVDENNQPIMAKYVSDQFKEKHKANMDWKMGKDLITALAEQYRTEARWLKVVNRYQETGNWLGDPKDIGPMMKLLNEEFEDEVAAELQAELWKHARKICIKVLGKGFAEWYKNELKEMTDASDG